MPTSEKKRLSFIAPNSGHLFYLTRIIIPMIGFILIIVAVSVALAYSLNGHAIPRQFVVGMCITLSTLVVLWAILSAIRCGRAKCAGKYNLRLESPPAKPMPGFEMGTPGLDPTGHGNLYNRTKQAPAVARQGRESMGLGNLYDRFKQDFKDWLDEHYLFRHYRGSGRARAPVYASRDREPPVSRYAHNYADRRREDTAESEGMLSRWRRRYLYSNSDSEITNDSADDIYLRRNDRDYRGAQEDLHHAHQAHCEDDENRSQDLDNTEAEPARADLRRDIHHYNVSPRQMEWLLTKKNLYVKLPAPAHNPRR